MFKTVFKMSTTTHPNRLYRWVFDIFYSVFDNVFWTYKIYHLLRSFLNYTKWSIIFKQKTNFRWQKYTNKNIYKKHRKLMLKTEKKPIFQKLGWQKIFTISSVWFTIFSGDFYENLFIGKSSRFRRGFPSWYCSYPWLRSGIPLGKKRPGSMGRHSKRSFSPS